MDEREFHGISLSWMQAQWRDCADKDEQLKIYQDMTGASAEEIIAVLEPDFTPRAFARRNKNKPWTPEDDARLLEMKAAKVREADIASRLGRPFNAVHARYGLLRKEARRKEEREAEKGEEVEEKIEAEVLCAEEVSGGGSDAAAEEPEEHAYQVVSECATSLKEVEAELRDFKKEELRIMEELQSVRNIIGAYKKKLVELIALAGGALT